MSAGSCHADISPFVTKLCVGKTTCTIVADIDVVNGGKDPCPGVAKSVYAELACSGSGTFPKTSGQGLVGYASDQVHIVGWDPEPNPTTPMFKPSTYEFSSNAFAYRGLRILSTLANASAGSAYQANGSRYEHQAQALRGNMMRKMWNGTSQSFCDGICTDPLVQSNRSGGFGGIYTRMYSLYLGLVPPQAAASTWSYVADWGLELLGDWGAYALQSALTDFDEGWTQGESGNVEANGGGDDGTALLTMLTKCDDDSWCAMWQKYNATMTREAFPTPLASNGNQGETLSHPWGTAATPAIVQGIVGVTPTSPEYATFKIKPRLGGGASKGGLQRVSLTMPTLRGKIKVNISVAADGKSNYTVSASISCNTWASVCVPQEAGSTLTLDGKPAPAVKDGRHWCVEQVGCGAGFINQHGTWMGSARVVMGRGVVLKTDDLIRDGTRLMNMNGAHVRLSPQVG